MISSKQIFFLLMLFTCVYSYSATIAIPSTANESLTKQLQHLEKSNNGHIGMFAIDLNNNSTLSMNGQKRVSMQCTAKTIGVATILKQSMTNPNLLNQRIFYNATDLVSWSPITAKHLHDGMTVGELCAATIEYSDNTAMNLLVNKMGGLPSMNQFAKSIGNLSFRQDEIWPKEANRSPYDPEDTSTPKDMAQSLHALLFTNTLAKTQQSDLTSWLKNCKTGNKRIRSGVPNDWIVGDKTGTGSYYGITNDLAAIWAPQCKPIIIAIYYYSNQKNAPKNEKILGDIAKLTISTFAKHDICLNTALKNHH